MLRIEDVIQAWGAGAGDAGRAEAARLLGELAVLRAERAAWRRIEAYAAHPHRQRHGDLLYNAWYSAQVEAGLDDGRGAGATTGHAAGGGRAAAD